MTATETILFWRGPGVQEGVGKFFPVREVPVYKGDKYIHDSHSP